MVQRVDNDDDGKRDKAWAQAAAFRAQLESRKAAQSSTEAVAGDDNSIADDKTTKNKSRELHAAQSEGFDVKATNASVIGVASAGQSGNSFNQGGQGGGEGNHQDKTAFMYAHTISDHKPNRVSFDFVQSKGDSKEIQNLQKAVMTQYETRYGMQLSADVKDAIYAMNDLGELKSALKVMAQGKRADIAEPKVAAFESTLLNAHSDFFSPIDAAAIRQQQGLA